MSTGFKEYYEYHIIPSIVSDTGICNTVTVQRLGVDWGFYAFLSLHKLDQLMNTYFVFFR